MIWLSVAISRSNVIFRPVQWRWPTSSHPGAYYPDPHHPPCWLVVVVEVVGGGGQSVRRVSQHIWHGSLGARDMYMRNYSVDCPFGVRSSKDGCAWVARCCFHARLPVSPAFYSIFLRRLRFCTFFGWWIIYYCHSHWMAGRPLLTRISLSFFFFHRRMHNSYFLLGHRIYSTLLWPLGSSFRMDMSL